MSSGRGLRGFVTSKLQPRSPLTRLAVSAFGRIHGVDVDFQGDLIVFRKRDRWIRIALSRFPYARDMIVYFDSYYNAVHADERGLVDYSSPRIHRYRSSGVSFHLPSIAEEDEAIDSYFRWYHPQPGDMVFDLGAHAGVSTYFLSQAVGPSGRVYAFEPDPEAWDSLLRNIADLALENVRPVQKAVAGRSGKVAFQAEGAVGSALVSVASRASSGDTIAVDAITFEEACELAGGVPAFVKTDIEGAELEVVASALPVLRRSRCQFAVDTNHMVDGRLTNKRLEDLFSEAGYESLSSAEFGFMTTWARPASPAKHDAGREMV
jgi:FkbM family methyltransferase